MTQRKKSFLPVAADEYSLILDGTSTYLDPKGDETTPDGYERGELLSALYCMFTGEDFKDKHIVTGIDNAGTLFDQKVAEAILMALKALSEGKSLVKIMAHSRGAIEAVIVLLRVFEILELDKNLSLAKYKEEVLKIITKKTSERNADVVLEERGNTPLIKKDKSASVESDDIISFRSVQTLVSGDVRKTNLELNLNKLKNIIITPGKSPIQMRLIDPVPGQSLTDLFALVKFVLGASMNWSIDDFFKRVNIAKDDCHTFTMADEQSQAFEAAFIMQAQRHFRLRANHGTACGKLAYQTGFVGSLTSDEGGLQTRYTLKFMVAVAAKFYLDTNYKLEVVADEQEEKVTGKKSPTHISKMLAKRVRDFSDDKDDEKFKKYKLKIYEKMHRNYATYDKLRGAQYGHLSNKGARKLLVGVENGVPVKKLMDEIPELRPIAGGVNREHLLLKLRHSVLLEKAGSDKVLEHLSTITGCFMEPEGKHLTVGDGVFGEEFDDECSLMKVRTALSKTQLASLPIETNSAYIRYSKQLFYVNMDKGELIEIPEFNDEKGYSFDAIKKTQVGKPVKLTKYERQQAILISGHNFNNNAGMIDLFCADKNGVEQGLAFFSLILQPMIARHLSGLLDLSEDAQHTSDTVRLNKKLMAQLDALFRSLKQFSQTTGNPQWKENSGEILIGLQNLLDEQKSENKFIIEDRLCNYADQLETLKVDQCSVTDLSKINADITAFADRIKAIIEAGLIEPFAELADKITDLRKSAQIKLDEKQRLNTQALSAIERNLRGQEDRLDAARAAIQTGLTQLGFATTANFSQARANNSAVQFDAIKQECDKADVDYAGLKAQLSNLEALIQRMNAVIPRMEAAKASLDGTKANQVQLIRDKSKECKDSLEQDERSMQDHTRGYQANTAGEQAFIYHADEKTKRNIASAEQLAAADKISACEQEYQLRDQAFAAELQNHRLMVENMKQYKTALDEKAVSYSVQLKRLAAVKTMMGSVEEQRWLGTVETKITALAKRQLLDPKKSGLAFTLNLVNDILDPNIRKTPQMYAQLKAQAELFGNYDSDLYKHLANAMLVIGIISAILTGAALAVILVPELAVLLTAAWVLTAIYMAAVFLVSASVTSFATSGVSFFNSRQPELYKTLQKIAGTEFNEDEFMSRSEQTSSDDVSEAQKYSLAF